MKIALLETIEALVSAIKSKFLTKTEAESIYQPKASAINTGNIGRQSVNYASSAYSASSANSADSLYGGTAISSGTAFPSPGTYSMKYFLAKGSETDITGLPPVNASVIHMGAYINSSCDHQLALGNDGELYTRYIRNSAWQSWTRMAKASEIPSVSGFATEDWVTSNYYNLQEMDENYYNADDIDSMLDNFLPKSGGTLTGTLNVKDLVVNPRIYESSKSDSHLVFQAYMVNNNTKRAHNYGYGADVIAFGKGWTEMTPEYLYYRGYIHTTEHMRIKDILLSYDPSNNTLNLSGVSGQTVHLALNGKVIV